MPALPTSEPTSLTAGETLAWTKTLPDYSAASYVLKYAIQASGKPLLTLTATASGTAHAIAVTAAVTALYAPGVYTWTSYVEDLAGTTRVTIARGTVTIFPSPLAVFGSTHAGRMLALIETALEGRIPNGLETTNIDGQELQRIPVKDLFDLRQKYQQIVHTEALAARSAAGLSVRRTIGIRFVAP